MYRVLIVMPNVAAEKLDTQHEIHWIARSFRAETCTGVTTQSHRVTVNDFMSFVTGRKFDIVHFIADGTDKGIHMDGDTILDMDEIAQVARSCNTKLVYLNSCRSARLAQYMIDQGVPAVIASTMDLKDHNAWSTASYFYQALLELQDFYSAYERAKPGDGSISFYSDGKLVHRSVQPIMNSIASLSESVNNLSQTVIDNRKERIEKIEEIDDKVVKNKGIMEQHGQDLAVMKRWMVIGSASTVFMWIVLITHSIILARLLLG